MRINKVVSLIVVLFFPKIESCGERKIKHSPLIYHGYETEPGSFPWHVAIYVKKGLEITFKCGGTLISEDIVLTAAQCVYDFDKIKPFDPSQIIVHLGKHNILAMSSYTKEFRVKSIKVHEQFVTNKFENDIAKVQLDGFVELTPYIQPICLWDSDRRRLSEIENKLGTVVGWGCTQNGAPSDTLQTATVPMVSRDECLNSNRYVYNLLLLDFKFCGGHRNGTSPCGEDHGGGLYFEEDGIWKLRGIVSYGVQTGGSSFFSDHDYTIFTDVAPYLEWINIPFHLSVSNCEKGDNYIMPRIESINSIEANPWEAIIYNVSIACCCNATLISANSLMTHGSCPCLTLPIASLRIGMILRNKIFSTEIFYSIGDIKILKKHSKINIDDLALINLKENILFDENVYPIGFPSSMTPKHNEIFYVAGKNFTFKE